MKDTKEELCHRKRNQTRKRRIDPRFRGDAEIFRAFGQAIGELFDDPEMKRSAKQFADSAADSAKTLVRRFKDEEVKAKFRDVGKAAEEFGKSVADHFKEEKRE